MSFDLLSNELIAEIFKHLHQSDCLRLSLCCHGFRDVVEPFLYGEFVQRKKGDLALFLRSLIEKPARGIFVLLFCLEGCGFGVLLGCRRVDFW